MTDDQPQQKGQLDVILEDFKERSQKMLHELAEMEDILVQMKDHIEKGDRIDGGEMLVKIEKLRTKIGVMEHIDSEEFQEERDAINIMQHLKELIAKTV